MKDLSVFAKEILIKISNLIHFLFTICITEPTILRENLNLYSQFDKWSLFLFFFRPPKSIAKQARNNKLLSMSFAYNKDGKRRGSYIRRLWRAGETKWIDAFILAFYNKVARPEGLEPSTSGFGDLRSTNWTKDAKSGGKGIRTPDLLRARQTHYQLCYTPFTNI